MTLVEISNDGPAITRTNYWQLDHAREGLLYLSINAGTIRVLVPPKTERVLLSECPELGTPLTLTEATYQGRATYVLQWDEPAHTGIEPYSIDVDRRQIDRQIADEEWGRVVPIVWYVRAGAYAVREARRELVQLGLGVAS